MNFKGHFTGGLIAGTTASCISLVSVKVQNQTILIQELVDSPFIDNPLKTTFFVFLTAWFMALFPDLDTASIVQRWFYRILILILFVLMINRQIEYFIILSFVGLFPLIDKHRGWTHWTSAPFIITIFLAIVFEYIRAKDTILPMFKMNNVFDFIKHYWIYILAAFMGHQMHLFLDKPKAKTSFLTRWMNK